MLPIAMMAVGMPAAEAQPPARCEALLADYAGWREAPGQKWDYESAKLVLIGAEHVRDPAHPQFGRIAAAFDRAKPNLVLFEGPDRGEKEDAEATIRAAGESGYVRFLGKQAGLRTLSLEPSPPAQVKALLSQFPADQVLLFFVLREAARLRDREGLSGAALDSAVARLLDKLKPMGPAIGISLPFSDVAELGVSAARYWPGRDWRTIASDWFSPLADDKETGGRFLAAINRADSNNRNRHMLALIAAASKAGEKPFVVVGRNHVPMLTPALRCATGP